MKKGLNQYWLQVNKAHKELKWMSYDEWPEETQTIITDAVNRLKQLLDILTSEVENEKR